MTNITNHYEVLGVDREATKTEIESAYRNLIRHEHPDAGGSTEKAALITAAYTALKDKHTRARHDKELRDAERAARARARAEQASTSPPPKQERQRGGGNYDDPYASATPKNDPVNDHPDEDPYRSAPSAPRAASDPYAADPFVDSREQPWFVGSNSPDDEFSARSGGRRLWNSGRAPLLFGLYLAISVRAFVGDLWNQSVPRPIPAPLLYWPALSATTLLLFAAAWFFGPNFLNAWRRMNNGQRAGVVALACGGEALVILGGIITVPLWLPKIGQLLRGGTGGR